MRIVRLFILILLAFTSLDCNPRHDNVPRLPGAEELARLDPDLAQALLETSEEIKAAPGKPAPWLRLAKLYHAHALDGLANIAYRHSLDLGAGEDQVWCFYALSLERGGDLEEAVEAMQQCIERLPDSVPARWRQSLWLSELGRLDEADRVIEGALGLDPTDPMARIVSAKLTLLRGDVRSALELIEELSLVPGPNRQHLLFLEATARRRLGQPGRAETLLAELDDPKPVWIDPWHRELLTLQVGIVSRRARASALTRSGRFVQAVPILEDILRKENDDYRSWNLLGNSYFRLGQTNKSTRCFRRATNIKPTHFGSQLNLVTSLIRSFPKNPVTLEEAERAIVMRPTSSIAHSLLGTVHLVSGRLHEALQAFDQAAARATDPTTPSIQAGLLEIRLGRIDAARQRLESLDPESVDRRLGEAALLATDNQLEAADEIFSLAISAGATPSLARQVRILIDSGPRQ